MLDAWDAEASGALVAPHGNRSWDRLKPMVAWRSSMTATDKALLPGIGARGAVGSAGLQGRLHALGHSVSRARTEPAPAGPRLVVRVHNLCL
jgi:hypothetical protein